MPKQGWSTEKLPFFLSKTTKDIHQPIVPILFSLLESHASEAEFMRSNQKWEEMCGMMGNLAADRRRRKGQTVQSCGNPLPRLPTERGGGGAHEGGRTHPIPQHAQGGDGRAHVQRLPKDRQAAHLTRGKAHRESPEWTVRKSGLLNNVWNHMETYGNMWNRMVTYGIIRNRMETYGSMWNRMETYSNVWKHVKSYGNVW